MLTHAGADFKTAGAENPGAGSGFAPPYLTLASGETIAQSTVIPFALGQELKLAPSGSQAKALQISADAGDLLSEIFAGKPDERVNKWLNYIAEQLNSSGFFFDQVSYADFMMWPTIELINLKKAAGKLEGVTVPEALVAWKATMDALPAVSSMNLPLFPPNFV